MGPAFVLVTALFFFWDVPNNLNDALIRQFTKSFAISHFQVGLVQSAFYLGYVENFRLGVPSISQAWVDLIGPGQDSASKIHDIRTAGLFEELGNLPAPVMLFVGKDGRVRKIHPGLATPVSSVFNAELQTEFTSEIESLLAETPATLQASVLTPANGGNRRPRKRCRQRASS